MWFPGQGISNEVRDLFIAALNDPKVKEEFEKRFQENLDKDKTKEKISKQARRERDINTRRKSGDNYTMSYESLTSGNVNLQARMAASGYDVYGRTIIQGAKSVDNNNLYQKMKNRIKYGRSPEIGYENHGERTMI